MRAISSFDYVAAAAACTLSPVVYLSQHILEVMLTQWT